MSRTKSLWSLVFPLIVVFTSSHGDDTEGHPANNRADNVHGIAQADFQNSMRDMADRVSAIFRLTVNDGLSVEEQRDQIVPLLDSINQIATELDGEAVVTDYSVISWYMGAFLYDVMIAKQFALSEPSNLVPAQQLLKSCLACHESL